MKFLVTGCAGFIGMHLAQKLLASGHTVIGIDSLSDYYDVTLKQARLQQLVPHAEFKFFQLDIAHMDELKTLWETQGPFDQVIHLAAQAGVRYSISHPHSYVTSNLVGFINILECCRHQRTLSQLLYASSSSVYGANETIPFSEEQKTISPISLYAATKASNELLAQSYYHLYNIPMVGLRFFTVYGPWGRPDMAYFKFTQAIIKDNPIDVYNFGKMRRDFTFIDDIINGITLMINKPLKQKQSHHPIYNLGNNRSEELQEMITILEACIGKTAIKNLLPMQPGDVVETYADISLANGLYGYTPKTPISVGLPIFVKWFNDYYS